MAQKLDFGCLLTWQNECEVAAFLTMAYSVRDALGEMRKTLYDGGGSVKRIYRAEAAQKLLQNLIEQAEVKWHEYHPDLAF